MAAIAPYKNKAGEILSWGAARFLFAILLSYGL